jgi:hypothetical protein
MLITRPRLGGTIPRRSNSKPKQREQPEAVNISTSSRAIREAVVDILDREVLDILREDFLSVIPSIEERSDLDSVPADSDEGAVGAGMDSFEAEWVLFWLLGVWVSS